MMPKPDSRVGISTGAETAWYERELEPEHESAERTSDRWLEWILFGSAFSIVGGVVALVLWLS